MQIHRRELLHLPVEGRGSRTEDVRLHILYFLFYAIDNPQAHAIYKKYIDQIDDRYESLSDADRETVWCKPTEKAKEYRAYESEMRKKMYSEIAQRCEEYDKKHKSRDLER